MEAQTCKSCTHFYQHYVLTETYGFPVDCGHCRKPRIKHRKASDKACGHYLLRSNSDTPQNRSEVVHFLTTTVLERILELEIPPEIAP